MRARARPVRVRVHVGVRACACACACAYACTCACACASVCARANGAHLLSFPNYFTLIARQVAKYVREMKFERVLVCSSKCAFAYY